MRRVLYVTGTRADFGLFRRTLKLAAASPQLDVSVCVTGMHLSARYGNTVSEVEASGIRIAGTVPVDAEQATGAAMARAIGTQVVGMTDLFLRVQPDVVVVLGDRGEMLAAAIAAVHLNIIVVHIHGGERTGTVDDAVRHAISKLAHFHLAATDTAARCLRALGEPADRIQVTGAPGLDGLGDLAAVSREELLGRQGLDPARPTALVVFHPVVQQESQAGRQAAAVAEALRAVSLQALWLTPNSDAGGDRIREELERLGAGMAGKGHVNGAGVPGPAHDIAVTDHLDRREYVSWLAAADVMVGNSSSGIIEAPSFGTPVVNVGVRQRGRERSSNIIDTPADTDAIVMGIREALKRGRQPGSNAWGDGRAGERIVQFLETMPLDDRVLEKSNVV
jgi:GDP/UDP-N,N'-diacetylbacillosamine 2-epimerase (hydrolysing)